jgi:hypothetical protein
VACTHPRPRWCRPAIARREAPLSILPGCGPGDTRSPSDNPRPRSGMPPSARPPRSQLRAVAASKALGPRVPITHPGPPSLPAADPGGWKSYGLPVAVNHAADINPVTSLNALSWCSRPGRNADGRRHATRRFARDRQADPLRSLDGTAVDAANRAIDCPPRPAPPRRGRRLSACWTVAEGQL